MSQYIINMPKHALARICTGMYKVSGPKEMIDCILSNLVHSRKIKN